MPELPEVETIARALRQGGRDGPPLVGRTIERASLFWPRTLKKPSPSWFRKRIKGQTILDVGRRAKYLKFQLSRDTLLVHLGMTGDMVVSASDEPLAPHDRMTLELDTGLRLAFNDPRKFGRVWLLPDPDLVFAKLGPEPLHPPLATDEFYTMLQSRRRQLKPLLMDQTFLAGVGNIYADEALHLARLHPRFPSNQVSTSQAEELIQAIQTVLEEGIRRNGATIDWAYKGGGFQNQFQVYQRTDQPCLQCEAPIVRIQVGQRSTHFCPSCQPEPAD